MATLQHPYATANNAHQKRTNLLNRFIAWSTKEEKNRLGWVAIILTSHACFITPLALLFVMMAGNHFIYWPFIIGAMGMCLIANLAALPTRVIIPIFILSILIDILISTNCIVIGLAGA